MTDMDSRIIPIKHDDKVESRRAAAFILASSGLLISVGVGLLIAIFCVVALAQGGDTQIIPMLNTTDRPEDEVAQDMPAQISTQQLPSISMIDEKTDITVFLRDDVSSELRTAALRRAWLMDPKIHDFRGLQEVDWDFEIFNSIPGFGPLGPGFDIARMVAQIIGTPNTYYSTKQAITYTRIILASILFKRTERAACE